MPARCHPVSSGRPAAAGGRVQARADTAGPMDVRSCGPDPDAMTKQRLDQVVATRGLATTRSQARQLVVDGLIRLNGAVVTSPGRRVDRADAIERDPAGADFVSRGGRKLAAALDYLALSVRGLRCLDVGSSTGGFTDCLLQRGAASVIAVDVGTQQLHPSLRTHPRVVVRERQDVRRLERLAPPIDAVVADLSFIRLRDVVPALARAAPQAGWILSLLKPQFELPGRAVPRDGIVKDAGQRRLALDAFRAWCATAGFDCVGSMPSPVAGGGGNRETFVLLRPPWPD